MEIHQESMKTREKYTKMDDEPWKTMEKPWKNGWFPVLLRGLHRAISPDRLLRRGAQGPAPAEDAAASGDLKSTGLRLEERAEDGASEEP